MAVKFIRAAMVFVLLAATITTASAQTYRLLNVNDFQAQPHKTNFSTVAYTNCSISYSYTVSRVRGVFKLNFKVTMSMNKHLSWLDRAAIKNPEMLAEVLNHEQGHYAIAYLQQQEVLRTFASTQFGRDYNIAARQIFDRIDKKYQQMNDTYERETNHMQNRGQQTKWDKHLKKCLNSLSPAIASN